MEGFTPWAALVGGTLIGLAALLLLLCNGRIAGISGIIGGSLTPTRGDLLWRVLFVAGLFAGGLVMLWVWPAALDIRIDVSTPAVILAGLLVGFGAGWGLVGLCPGPAVVALATLHEDVLVFFVSMIAGMYAYGTLHVIGSHDPDGGASALDLLLGKR